VIVRVVGQTVNKFCCEVVAENPNIRSLAVVTKFEVRRPNVFERGVAVGVTKQFFGIGKGVVVVLSKAVRPVILYVVPHEVGPVSNAVLHDREHHLKLTLTSAVNQLSETVTNHLRGVVLDKLTREAERTAKLAGTERHFIARNVTRPGVLHFAQFLPLHTALLSTENPRRNFRAQSIEEPTIRFVVSLDKLDTVIQKLANRNVVSSRQFSLIVVTHC